MQWLQRRGFEAYLVGGCVRDLLLGLEPKDFDIATSARPPQVKRVFPRNCRIIGRRFKLAHLHFHHNTKILECSTFRRTPSEERSGDDLLITQDNEFGSAEEDALRRDFTINALFFDPTQDRILDWTGGLDDLKARVIRTIGDPITRFREDPVRILRAAKFAGRLGFEIDAPTLDAMATTAVDLNRAAPPRVLEEILRLLRTGHALDAFQILRDIGAIKVLLPVVGEYLATAEESERVGLWRLLDALDARVRSGHVPSNPVLLGTLFGRPVAHACAAEPERAPATIAESLLGPFANTLRLPRRDSGCLKRICGVLGRFRSQGTRRFRVQAFLRDPYGPEALDLFELHCLATGEGRTELDEWLELAGQAADAERRDEDDFEAARHDAGSDDGAEDVPADEGDELPFAPRREERGTDAPDAAEAAPTDDDERGDPPHAEGPAGDATRPMGEGGRRRRRRRGRGRGRDREAASEAGPATTPVRPHDEDAAPRSPTSAETDLDPYGDSAGGSDVEARDEGAAASDDSDPRRPEQGDAAFPIPESEFRKLSRSARRRRLRKLRRQRQGEHPAERQPGASEEWPRAERGEFAEPDAHASETADLDAPEAHGEGYPARLPEPADAAPGSAFEEEAGEGAVPGPREPGSGPTPQDAERDDRRGGRRRRRRRGRGGRDREGAAQSPAEGGATAAPAPAPQGSAQGSAPKGAGQEHGGGRRERQEGRRGKRRGRGEHREHRDDRIGRDRRAGKVEVLEPEQVDRTPFEVELDPTRAPTFGAGVENQNRKRSPIRRVLLEEDKEPYKPPPPPDLNPSGAPPIVDEPEAGGGGGTFGDW